MSRTFLTVIVMFAALSAARAQQDTGGALQSAPNASARPSSGASQKPSAPQNAGRPRNPGSAPSVLGSPESTPGGLAGVYGPPASDPGHLSGVYNPPQPSGLPSLPTTITGPSASNSGSVPNVNVPGRAREGEPLPVDAKPTPMSDRPGYGRAMVNGRPAIIDLSDNRIVQLSDSSGLSSSGQLTGVYGPASPTRLSSSVGSSPLSSTLAGSTNSSVNGAAAAPGAILPAGAQTSPAPYGAAGYGQAWVAGRMVLIDRSNNRIVGILR